MNFLRKRGYFCIRSYASKGPFDIVAVPPSKGSTLLIQAKYNGYVPKYEIQQLKEIQKKIWGLVTIAYSENHKLRFKSLNEWAEMDYESRKKLDQGRKILRKYFTSTKFD